MVACLRIFVGLIKENLIGGFHSKLGNLVVCGGELIEDARAGGCRAGIGSDLIQQCFHVRQEVGRKGLFKGRTISFPLVGREASKIHGIKGRGAGRSRCCRETGGGVGGLTQHGFVVLGREGEEGVTLVNESASVVRLWQE